jgi:argininosuccinate lyase
VVKQQESRSYRGFRTAGIRLTEELIPSLMDHKTESLGDELPPMHKFDKVHLVMLTETGLIPKADGVAMLRALREMEKQGIEKARIESGGGMHSGEQWLIRRLGESVGGRIHLGRSSGDVGEIGRRVAMRAHILALLPLINEFRAVLLDLADRHLDTVMPGYTHGQHAQPTTFGHWLSMWASIFSRDFARFSEFYDRLNQSPAGAAILTGTEFAIDRHRQSELFGFDAPIRNTIDAILSHDEILECSAALAIHGSNTGRLGEDLMLWSMSEFAMIDVPDRFCGTSSIMMQKKNPYAPQAMKGLAAESAGLMTTALVVEKGATGLPIMERALAEKGMWSVFESAKARLRDSIELFPALIVKKERMLELAGSYWGQATDVAGALVREKGLPWRTAHQIVGILVRLSIERGIPPLKITPSLVDEAAIDYMGKPVGLSGEALSEALDPTAFVGRRTLFGGPAPKAAQREVAFFREQLKKDKARATALTDQVTASDKKLEEAIDALVSA